MTRRSRKTEGNSYQQQALQGVSRTFALTIPLLPTDLQNAVGNAYLLCRIADTIEDDRAMSAHHKKLYSDDLIRLVSGDEGGSDYASRLSQSLARDTPAAEADLVAHMPTVLDTNRALKSSQQEAIKTCVSKMATGMPEFQQLASRDGLADLATLNSYCYYVAGVVGELLTSLFCDYSDKIARHRPNLAKLSYSFGQALQLTNILKDIWVDHERGVSWLPKDMFNIGDSTEGPSSVLLNPSFRQGMNQLIGITGNHLKRALDYILIIPSQEKEIRQFLALPMVLALLTLRKLSRLENSPGENSIKISRRSVLIAALVVRFGAHHDRLLKQLFKTLSRGLPTAAYNPLNPAASHSG